MDLGSAARSTGAEWIGQPPHEDLERKAPTASSLPIDPFYEPPAGFEHARPAPCCARRDVELAFLGLVPQQFTATQLLYRTTDMNGMPQAAVTTVIVPDRTRGRRARSRSCPTSARSTPLQARCFPSYALRRRAKALGALAQFEFLLVAAALAEGWAVSVPDHEGPKGMWGAPYEPGYHVLDGVRAALQLRTSRPVARRAGGPVGLLGRRPGQRMGRRSERRLRTRTQHRRRGARVAGRRSRPHLPPAQRQLLFRAARDGGGRAVAHLSRPGQGHPGARHRRGQGDAAADREDDHRPRRAAPDRQGHGRPGRRPLEQILRHARGAARLRRASSWAPRCRRRRC